MLSNPITELSLSHHITVRRFFTLQLCHTGSVQGTGQELEPLGRWTSIDSSAVISKYCRRTDTVTFPPPSSDLRVNVADILVRYQWESL